MTVRNFLSKFKILSYRMPLKLPDIVKHPILCRYCSIEIPIFQVGLKVKPDDDFDNKYDSTLIQPMDSTYSLLWFIQSSPPHTVQSWYVRTKSIKLLFSIIFFQSKLIPDFPLDILDQQWVYILKSFTTKFWYSLVRSPKFLRFSQKNRIRLHEVLKISLNLAFAILALFKKTPFDLYLRHSTVICH